MVKGRSSDAPGALRLFLLGLVLLGILATTAELILLEHTEEPAQWLPLALLGAGLVAAVAAGARPGPATLRAFQVLMAGFVLAGGLGLWFHYRGNVEFELEMYPGLKGLELFRKSLSGATPALAPGMMSHLGLLGLAFTYRHPDLSRKPRATAHPETERSPS